MPVRILKGRRGGGKSFSYKRRNCPHAFKGYRLPVDQDFADDISGFLTWANLSSVKNVRWIWTITWMWHSEGAEKLSKVTQTRKAGIIMEFRIPPESLETLESYQNLGIFAIFPKSSSKNFEFLRFTEILDVKHCSERSKFRIPLVGKFPVD